MNLYYTESNGTSALTQLLASQSVSPGTYVPVYGSALIPQSNNTDTNPNAYIDIYFQIPVNTQWDISTVMVTPTGSTALTTQLPYDQASPYRQIDHLYHVEYPIVPVGTIIDFYGFNAPAHYLLCDGTNTYSRVQYQQLFQALTLVLNITQASSTTFTGDATKLGIGMYVEGAGISVGTSITGISAYITGEGSGRPRRFAGDREIRVHPQGRDRVGPAARTRAPPKRIFARAVPAAHRDETA